MRINKGGLKNETLEKRCADPSAAEDPHAAGNPGAIGRIDKSEGEQAAGGGMKYRLTIPGRPVPAARMTQRGKWVKRQAQRYLGYRGQVAWTAKGARLPTLEGLVEMTIRIYLAGKNGALPGRRGDLDNYCKAIKDGLQAGGVFPNDKQVVRYGTGTGIYPCEPGNERVEVELWELRDGEIAWPGR